MNVPRFLAGYRPDWVPREPILDIVPDRTPKEGYRPSRREKRYRSCGVCGAEFDAKIPDQAVCSRACLHASRASGRGERPWNRRKEP